MYVFTKPDIGAVGVSHEAGKAAEAWIDTKLMLVLLFCQF